MSGPDYAVGPASGHVESPDAWHPPATREQRELGATKARIELAAIGVPCVCGCGPLVHRHVAAAGNHCGFCGDDVCRTYRKAGPAPAVTRIPDPPPYGSTSAVA
jgi:hypothetical protein